jgi:hypothetical protein
MKILKEERGQVIVFVAVIMGLVMLGFLALAIDAGYLFHQKRMAQAAADAAAVAAAQQLSNGSTYEQNAADIAATKNGFDTTLTTNPASVALSTLNSGNYSNANGATAPSNWVQAVVSQPIHTFFLGAFIPSMRSVTVSAYARAGVSAANTTCICLLNTTGTDLNMSNNAQLAAGNNCAITANSSSSDAIKVVGSASVCAKSVGAVATSWNNTSNINNNGSICPTATAVEGATKCSSNLAPPALPSGITCYDNPIVGYVMPANSYSSNNYNGYYTLPFSGQSEMSNGQAVAVADEVAKDGVICYNSLNTANAAGVVFKSGYTYYIKGDFTAQSGAKLTGSGVKFYVGGNLNIANGVTDSLSAPLNSSGVPDTLFYVNGSSVTLAGGANSTWSGTVYAPNADVTLNNGTDTSMTMDVVAKTLTMAGGATLSSYNNPALGSSGSGAPALSQ